MSGTEQERGGKLFVYIVLYDYGFAPNPFHGYCTLATCKTPLRKSKEIQRGAWVVGLTSRKNFGGARRLVYAMQVSEILTFDEYAIDVRFQAKIPVAHGSFMNQYGDNIYFRNSENEWVQRHSRHSLAYGREDKKTKDDDINGEKVLVAEKFVYYGKNSIELPIVDLAHGKMNRNFKHNLPSDLVHDFDEWMTCNNQWGIKGEPTAYDALIKLYQNKTR